MLKIITTIIQVSFMYLKNSALVSFLVILTLVYSCANQTSPTGGPRDEDAPVLLNSSPQHESLNFSGQKVELEFDEYLKLKNPKEEIMITPRITGDYEIKLKKTKVIIELDDTLKSNTTYTFNFRESIQDLNEGNFPENLQLAFSTGPYLDSLSISGTSFHLLSNKKANDITVGLYESNDTLDVFNSPPVYLTKTNKSGEYIFNNIKNGTYDIYAIKDKNKNLKLESRTESYSFSNQPILLDSSLIDLPLPLINLDITPLVLQNSRVSGHYFLAKYNKYIEKYDLISLDSMSILPPSSISQDHREIKFYNSHQGVDSTGVIITAYDTLLNTIQDTVFVKFEETKRKRDQFEITYSQISIDKENPIVKTMLQFTKPSQITNLDSIYYQVDSTTHIHPDTSNLQWNDNNTQLSIELPLDKSIFDEPELLIPDKTDSITLEHKTSSTLDSIKNKVDTKLLSESSKSTQVLNLDNQLHFKPTAFISAETDSSLLHSEKINFIRKESLATLLLTVQTDETSYTLQLLDKQDKVTHESINQKTLVLNNLKPNTYRIRILIDTNQNGTWDIGSIIERIIPEPVIFYKDDEGNEEIPLRANWELGPLIIKF